jgi:Nucleotidyl transferase AbiEii toxin, Type IV TA system
MIARDRYSSAAAFRTALEQRLRAEAQSSGVPLSRLRKEAAFHRLLARLHQTAPATWALKGGLALIARLGAQVRGTRDADANWRATRRELDEALTAVEDLDLNDWFTFNVGDPRVLQGEGDEGALRFPVTAELDGRTFEQVNLDINVVNPQDPRPFERVGVRRNPFAFIDEPALEISMITPGQQLAEKLHAYSRLYHGEPSSRVKDLFDMLVIADEVQLPGRIALAAAVQQCFQIRTADWPPELPPPPPEWTQPWRGFVSEYPLRWTDLNAAFMALRQFWEPVFVGTDAADTTWDAIHWRWV